MECHVLRHMRLQLHRTQRQMSRQALRAEHLHKEIFSFSTLVVYLVCMTHNLLSLTVKILSSLYHTAGFMPMLLLTATACCEGCVQSPLHIQTSKFRAQPSTLPLRVTYQTVGLTNWGALGEPRGSLLSNGGKTSKSVLPNRHPERSQKLAKKMSSNHIIYCITYDQSLPYHSIIYQSHISHFPRAWLKTNKTHSALKPQVP